MERLLLALCISLPMLAVGQVPEPSLSSSTLATKRVRHFWLGASFASEAAYRTLDIAEPSNLVTLIVNDRNDREIPQSGYTTALGLTPVALGCFQVLIGLRSHH